MADQGKKTFLNASNRIDIRQKHLKSFLQLNFFMNAVIAVRLKKRPLAILKKHWYSKPCYRDNNN
ncbi:hypothetical protein B4098_1064 [Heyndrickxia coagulans]|uniref:Uncharacterized protein n=1 Tax=Heyndrickxia coagulans TaxID=1398 RepID=A0A150JVL4_HEYCO|nr:hypothetical protein B4098_1064 [Heyndrickxia coagulans]